LQQNPESFPSELYLERWRKMNGQHLSHGDNRVSEILREFEPERENVIPILCRIQDSTDLQYIPKGLMKEVADYLGITSSEIYCVISFYTMFSQAPRGKYVIRVCRSPPCYVMECTTVIDSLERILGIKMGETTRDGVFTLELSSCLGLCYEAPAMMINDEVYGNLTSERIEEIIKRKKHG
jgi:NADH-quinone oxidoreductase subunit E